MTGWPDMISVEESIFGWDLYLRDHRGATIRSLGCDSEDQARTAEDELRHAMASARDGDGLAAAHRWFDGRRHYEEWT